MEAVNPREVVRLPSGETRGETGSTRRLPPN